MRTVLPLLVVLLTAAVARADHGPMMKPEDEIGLVVAGFILFVFPPLLLAFLISLVIWRHFRPRPKKSNRPVNDPNWKLSELPPFPPPGAG